MFHSIAPCLLMALPDTVMLLAMHQEESAMGFILNRQTKLSFHELMPDLKIEPKIQDRRVLWGGPVSKNSGFLLYEHAPNRALDQGLFITETLSISPSKKLLEKAALGELKGRFDLILGYVAFGPGKLEQDLNKGTYLHSAFYEEIALKIPLSERFEHAFGQLGLSPIAFMNVVGGAQA
ncbi:MAG: YqgE/AlgH family protein [Myxococcaceae bacterium]